MRARPVPKSEGSFVAAIAPSAAASGASAPPRWRGSRRQDERGAEIAELAIAMPILALMLFAIIDFGSIYNQLESLRHGVQEAARVGVVPAQATPAWSDPNYASGTCTLTGVSPVTTTTGIKNLMCLVKDEIGLGYSTRVDIKFATGPGGSSTSSWVAPSESNPTGAGTLLVCATYPVSSGTGFFAGLLNSKYLTSKAEYALEDPLPSGDTEVPGAETDPSGRNWSWCTP